MYVPPGRIRTCRPGLVSRVHNRSIHSSEPPTATANVARITTATTNPTTNKTPIRGPQMVGPFCQESGENSPDNTLHNATDRPAFCWSVQRLPVRHPQDAGRTQAGPAVAKYRSEEGKQTEVMPCAVWQSVGRALND